MADDLYSRERLAWEAMDAGDYVEAVRLLEPLAAAGSAYALGSLGSIYAGDRLGAPDFEKAIPLLEQAASMGSVSAGHRLGYVWRSKGELTRARAIFQEGAEQGFKPSMYWIGRMLVRGEGGDADRVAGVAWLTRGAGQGHVYCQIELFRLERLSAGSLFGRMLVRAKKLRFVLSVIPRLFRDPNSPDFY